MSTDLDYVSGQSVLPEEAFGISPSSLHKFFSEPHNWYREQVLGEKCFNGSTSTYLGTIVHYCAECFINRQPVNTLEICKYLFNNCYIGLQDLPSVPEEALEFLALNCNNPNVDVAYILSQYTIMSNTLISFIANLAPKGEAEELIYAKVIPNYYAAGSVDLRVGANIYDYKTTSSLSAPKTIAYEHKLQLLTYAWIHLQRGIKIETINIIYTTNHQVGRIGAKGKPLEDYPSTCTLLTHKVTSEDFEFIESLLKLVAESVEYSKEHPESVYLIFKDYRLKHSQPKTKFTF